MFIPLFLIHIINWNCWRTPRLFSNSLFNLIFQIDNKAAYYMYNSRNFYTAIGVSDSTCIDLAIAKPNQNGLTKHLWNYLSLICKTEILYIWQFNSYFQVPWYYCMCNVQRCMQNVVSFHAALSTADCRELSWSCMSWWSRNIVYLKIFPFWNKTHCLSNVNLWKIICFAS